MTIERRAASARGQTLSEANVTLATATAAASRGLVLAGISKVGLYAAYGIEYTPFNVWNRKARLV